MNKESVKSRAAGVTQWLLLLAFIVVVVFIVKVAVPWVIDRKNDFVYGKIRTTHLAFDMNPTDATTQLTYFTALNLDGRVIVYGTMPEPSQPIHLKGLQLHGEHRAKEPILLNTKLFNDDPYPDLVLTVNGSPFVYVAENGLLKLVENPDVSALQTP